MSLVGNVVQSKATGYRQLVVAEQKGFVQLGDGTWLTPSRVKERFSIQGEGNTDDSSDSGTGNDGGRDGDA